MLDIKMIRQNTDEIKERLATRGVKAEKIDALLEKDKLQTLDFEKEGNGSLYYTASLKYAIPYENQDARDEGLGVSYVITDVLTGEEIRPKTGTSLLEL